LGYFYLLSSRSWKKTHDFYSPIF